MQAAESPSLGLRPSPQSTSTKMPVFRPAVPEVSLWYDDGFGEPLTKQPPGYKPIIGTVASQRQFGYPDISQPHNKPDLSKPRDVRSEPLERQANGTNKYQSDTDKFFPNMKRSELIDDVGYSKRVSPPHVQFGNHGLQKTPLPAINAACTTEKYQWDYKESLHRFDGVKETNSKDSYRDRERDVPANKTNNQKSERLENGQTYKPTLSSYDSYNKARNERLHRNYDRGAEDIRSDKAQTQRQFPRQQPTLGQLLQGTMLPEVYRQSSELKSRELYTGINDWQTQNGEARGTTESGYRPDTVNNFTRETCSGKFANMDNKLRFSENECRTSPETVPCTLSKNSVGNEQDSSWKKTDRWLSQQNDHYSKINGQNHAQLRNRHEAIEEQSLSCSSDNNSSPDVHRRMEQDTNVHKQWDKSSTRPPTSQIVTGSTQQYLLTWPQDHAHGKSEATGKDYKESNDAAVGKPLHNEADSRNGQRTSRPDIDAYGWQERSSDFHNPAKTHGNAAVVVGNRKSLDTDENARGRVQVEPQLLQQAPKERVTVNTTPENVQVLSEAVPPHLLALIQQQGEELMVLKSQLEELRQQNARLQTPQANPAAPKESTISLGDLQLSQQLQNQSQASAMSEMVVDIPAYASPDRDDLNSSNSSDVVGVSQIDVQQPGLQNWANGNFGQVLEGQQVLYQDLIDKVQNILKKNATEPQQLPISRSSSESDLSTILGSPSASRYVGACTLLESPLLPRIQYMSLMLDGCDESCDADALVLKYLSDDQLANRNPDATSCFNPSLSIASRKYLQRYGLLADSSPVKRNKFPLTEEFDLAGGRAWGAQFRSENVEETNLRSREKQLPQKILDIDRLRNLPKLL